MKPIVPIKALSTEMPLRHKLIEVLNAKLRKQGYTSICLKSAPPTPTIRIDKGKSDALTKASFVSWRSVSTPS